MMNNKNKNIELAKSAVLMTAAVAVIAVAVHFFWFPATLQSAVFPVLVSYFPILFLFLFL